MTLNDSRNDHRSQTEKQQSPDPPLPYIPGAAGFLAPGPTYIAPSSSFFLANGSASASLIDFLPSRGVADRLLAQYWKAVHPIARAVHRGSFQRRYDAFWDDVTMGIEPPNSLQAVVFAAMFSGVVSMPEEVIVMDFGVGKRNLVENFQVGTETALGRANFIRTAKVETLQAFIMYMVGNSVLLTLLPIVPYHISHGRLDPLPVKKYALLAPPLPVLALDSITALGTLSRILVKSR